MGPPGALATSTEAVQVKILEPGDCWKTLATLIAKRAEAIFQRRAETREEGAEAWQLAQAQVERPLCSGVLRLQNGWLISFNSAQIGTGEIDVCVEPKRLVLLGRTPSIGAAPCKDCVVRVLKLPSDVDPTKVCIRREGPIIDLELQDARRSDVVAQAA
jgi:hypothetical protein